MWHFCFFVFLGPYTDGSFVGILSVRIWTYAKVVRGGRYEEWRQKLYIRRGFCTTNDRRWPVILRNNVEGRMGVDFVSDSNTVK